MNWLGLPEIASTHGADVDRILVLVHLLMIVMFVGWGALFVYMLVRFRRSRHPAATYGGLSSKAPKAAEWAVLVDGWRTVWDEGPRQETDRVGEQLARIAAGDPGAMADAAVHALPPAADRTYGCCGLLGPYVP